MVRALPYTTEGMDDDHVSLFLSIALLLHGHLTTVDIQRASVQLRQQ